MKTSTPPQSTPTTSTSTGKRDPQLVAALQDAVAKLPNSDKTKAYETMAKRIGCSATYVYRYLNDDFRGDLAKFETLARGYFAAEVLRTEGNQELVTEAFSVASTHRFLRQVKQHGYIGVGHGPAGRGKTCAARLYAAQDRASIYIHATMWSCGRHAIARQIKTAIKAKLGKNETNDEALVRLLTGSGRLLIIDNAQRLTESARRWIADFWDATRIPIALLGNPEIEGQWRRNDQHGSRVGLHRDITTDLNKDATAKSTASHLIRLHLPGYEDLSGDVARVVQEFGSCRAAAMQLSLTKAMLDGGKIEDPTQAWNAAKTQLITSAA